MRKFLFACVLLFSINAFAFHHFGLNIRTAALNHATLTRALIKCFGEDSVVSWRDRIIKHRVLSWTYPSIDSLGNVVEITRTMLPIDKDTLLNFMKRNHLLWSPYTESFSIYKTYGDKNPLHVDPEWVDHIKYPISSADGILFPRGGNHQPHVFHNDISEYSDSTWFKPLLKVIRLLDYENIDHLKNLSLFELSLFYSLGEYELAKLINVGEISAEIILDKNNVPNSVRVLSIADKSLIPMLTERLIGFWRYNNLKFYPESSDLERNKMILTIDAKTPFYPPIIYNDKEFIIRTKK